MSEDKRSLWIAVDFDGTLTSSDAWPNIASENPNAIHVIKRLQKDGHKIILHTCRQEPYLSQAVEWLNKRGVTPDSVNDNPWARQFYGDVVPGPKMFADYYIDDRSLGIKKTPSGSVDWKYIRRNYRKLFI